MTLPEAIQELRRVAGKTQQVLATELGIATKTLQLYESGRALPEPKNMLALAAYADRLDNDNLYDIFTGDALMKQLVPPPGYQISIDFGRIPPPSPARRRKGAKK
jgi:transcriptional regulator with XRE-family HTH domain